MTFVSVEGNRSFPRKRGRGCLIVGESFIETQKAVAVAVADDALLRFTVIICGIFV